MMKRLIVLLVALLMVAAFATVSFAGGWDKCKACHKTGDKPSFSKESLLKKFKTADEFVKAAKDSTNPMMKAFNKDEMLTPAAKELYGM